MKKHELTKDIVVLHVPAESFPGGIQPAFDKLKDRLPLNRIRAMIFYAWSNWIHLKKNDQQALAGKIDSKKLYR